MEGTDSSAGGDISHEETDTAFRERPSCSNLTDPEQPENIFLQFHKSYTHLTAITSSDKEKNESNKQDVVSALESLINKIQENIDKITKEHKWYMRFLGMKVFLHHILSKFVNESEMVTVLENIYEEVKPHLANPEIAYSGFLVMNTISTIIHNTNSLEKIKTILEECQTVYSALKVTNKGDSYYSGKELFSPEEEMVSNKEATLKYEKLVITNLLFLGSVYEKMGDHYKDIVCYHTAFSRMLNKGLVSPYKWVDFTTRLACVFIDDNNFKDARHHLSAATHVHEILEGKNKLTSDSSLKELLRNNAIHLALAWVRYCVLLFEKSKDEDRTKFIILYKNGYLFPNESTLLGEKNISDKYEDIILNERNIVFQNQRFISTIDKELVDNDHDELKEYSDIIREKNIGFGDFLQEIEEGNDEETDISKKKDVDKEKDNADKGSKSAKGSEEDGCLDSKTNEKVKSDESLKDSELTSNLFIQDKTDEEISTKDKNFEIKHNIEAVDKTNYENCDRDSKDFKTNTPSAKKCDETERKLVFSSLGYLPIEHTVTKDLVQNPEEARNLFQFAYSWSKQAQTFYPKNKDFYSHIHTMLNMVSLYRLCAYFQGRDNLEYRINLEQTRESILEQLVAELTEVQPESHLHVRLYQEMALLNVDLAMLNMCNIYNIHADDTYKLCALAEIQSHINHTYIVGDMLEKSTEIIDKEKNTKEGNNNTAKDEPSKDEIDVK